jgi:hypothetical protein
MAELTVQASEDTELDVLDDVDADDEGLPSGFKNRIVGYDPSVDPQSIAPHPQNAKIHPDNQKKAIRGALQEIGWIDTIKVNVRSGRMIDGHERREQAIAAGQRVPVVYVDLSPEEEALALATLDPIGSLANYDPERINSLLETVQTGSKAVATMLADMQVDATPTFKNTGQTGDRQQERVSVVRVAMQVSDVRTIERALAQTGVEDRGAALMALCRYYLQTQNQSEELGLTSAEREPDGLEGPEQAEP